MKKFRKIKYTLQIGLGDIPKQQSLRPTRKGRNKMMRKYDSYSDEHGLKAGDSNSITTENDISIILPLKKMIVSFTERDAFMAKMAGAQRMDRWKSQKTRIARYILFCTLHKFRFRSRWNLVPVTEVNNLKVPGKNMMLLKLITL